MSVNMVVYDKYTVPSNDVEFIKGAQAIYYQGHARFLLKFFLYLQTYLLCKQVTQLQPIVLDRTVFCE